MTITMITPATTIEATMQHRIIMWSLFAVMIGCSSADPFTPRPGESSPAPRASQRIEKREPIELDNQSDVETYVRLALERNPRIRAAERNVDRLAARIDQATSMDDPMFMVSPAGDMAETAAGQVGVMTSVSQRVPYPGKLAARGRVAAQDVAVAAAQLEQVKLDIAAQTRQAYWSHYFAVRAIDVTQESRALLVDFRTTAETLLEAGRAMQQDVLRASVEIGDVDRKLAELDQRKRSAAAMLNRMLDRAINAPIAEPPSLEPGVLSLQLDALLAEAGDNNPQLAAAHHRIEAFRQRLELARLSRRPDLTVGVNYTAVDDEGLSRMANGDDQWWLTFGINLPIWSSKYDAAEREARFGIQQEIAELTDAHNRVAFDVEDALARVESQQRLVTLFRDAIIPDAKTTVDASLNAYQSGKVEFLTLVDNWRRLLEFELQYHRSVAQLQRDMADLQKAVGREIAP
jgi:outer membrane protein TolC